MKCWTFLLLHSCFGVGVSLPAPSNVSISSFNMEPKVSFLPGRGTVSSVHFSVQLISERAKGWKPVPGCLELTAGQICNLTGALKNPYSQYKARVRAFTATQNSNWTVSAWFQPLSDTVLGPPDVSVSGCGNCLVLLLGVPAGRGSRHELELRSFYQGVTVHVQRSRDRAQFRLNMPFHEENVIGYLQPGVEYCVTVSVKAFLDHLPSEPHCAFTSQLSPTRSFAEVFGLLSASCFTALLFLGLTVYVAQLSVRRLRRSLQYDIQEH